MVKGKTTGYGIFRISVCEVDKQEQKLLETVRVKTIE